MAKGRWTAGFQAVADEAYGVLMKRERASRRFPRSHLIRLLARPEVYKIFLQHCLENDDSKSLLRFRKGLAFVVQGIGPSKVVKTSGINRITLHRMLKEKGNPSFDNLLRLFRALGFYLWLVDEEFKKHRSRILRPKDHVKSFGEFEEWADLNTENTTKREGRRVEDDPEDDLD